MILYADYDNSRRIERKGHYQYNTYLLTAEELLVKMLVGCWTRTVL